MGPLRARGMFFYYWGSEVAMRKEWKGPLVRQVREAGWEGSLG